MSQAPTIDEYSRGALDKTSEEGDPAVRSELRRKLSPMAPNMAANPERCQQKNPATGPSVV